LSNKRKRYQNVPSGSIRQKRTSLCVGVKRPILEMFPIVFRLVTPVPRYCPTDLGRETLNPIDGFGITSEYMHS
jgi:hypothetical protein